LARLTGPPRLSANEALTGAHATNFPLRRDLVATMRRHDLGVLTSLISATSARPAGAPNAFMEADMIRRFAFACAIAALSTSPTWAQSSTAPAAQPSAAPSADKFVQSQSVNEWRAAKLVGVSVVGSDNKKIGQIKDVLIDHDGAAQVVVISAGGFLGVGGKLVGVPFKQMKWHTEGRTVQISTAPQPGGGNGAGGAGAGGGGSAGAGVATTKTDPAATEASQGYPDVAQLDMTEAQLKQAPDFKYATEPAAPGESGSASTTNGQSGTMKP
jgi:hypothetical protein